MTDPSTPQGFLQSRQLLGWSQARLARELGVGVTAVAHWERGRRPIERRTVLAVKWLLRCWR